MFVIMKEDGSMMDTENAEAIGQFALLTGRMHVTIECVGEDIMVTIVGQKELGNGRKSLYQGICPDNILHFKHLCHDYHSFMVRMDHCNGKTRRFTGASPLICKWDRDVEKTEPV